MSTEISENITWYVCDFVFNSRKELNIHVIKEHSVLEQLDVNVFMILTVDSKKTDRQTELLETEVAFLIQFKERKTKEEVSNELEKLWDSNLKVGFSWDTLKSVRHSSLFRFS